VRCFAVVGFFDKRQKRFLENLVIIGAAQERFLAELVQRKAAVWAGQPFIRMPGQLVIRRLDGKQVAEQFIYRDISLDGDTLLVGAQLAKVHLGAHTVGNLRQMNSRFIFITNLALHIITPVSIIPKSPLK
jgi:hypothetical protein